MNPILYASFGNLTTHFAIMITQIFQRKHEPVTHKMFYKFAFIGLLVMVCMVLVFGTFLSATKFGNSGYDIKHEVTTSQPSTSASKLL